MFLQGIILAILCASASMVNIHLYIYDYNNYKITPAQLFSLHVRAAGNAGKSGDEASLGLFIHSHVSRTHSRPGRSPACTLLCQAHTPACDPSQTTAAA